VVQMSQKKGAGFLRPLFHPIVICRSDTVT